MLDPLIVKVITFSLGLMFLIAAFHKLTDLSEFVSVLHDYRILPAPTVPIAARIVLIAEVIIGGSWVLASELRIATALASASLLAVYATAIGINLLRGRMHIDCGCGFGGKTDSGQLISPGHVVRNLALALVASATLLPVTERQLGIGDYVALVAALLTVTLLFAAMNQLIANRALINTWRKLRD